MRFLLDLIIGLAGGLLVMALPVLAVAVAGGLLLWAIATPSAAKQ